MKKRIKKQQKQKQKVPILSAAEKKMRREAEAFNRCMQMMKVYCPHRGRYY